MHGQGNYPSQVGQGPYAPPPAFQQRPAPPPPPASHHGWPAPQPQVIQQGHPSFQPTPGIFAYQHALPHVPQQGPPASVVSSGMSSAQSYISHPQPPQVHVSTPISHSYPISEQHRQPWGQNVHQFPPTAPRPGPSAYPLPSSQGNTLERGRFHQPLPHALPAPPPPPPSYSSSSSFLTSDQFGSSALPMRHHSYPQQVGPLPPPPPPSSPPELPPLPPSLPSLDTLSKNDGNCNSKDLLDGVNLMLEHPLLVKLVEDGSAHQIEIPSPLTEKTGPKEGSVDALVAVSPADSDMDMEG